MDNKVNKNNSIYSQSIYDENYSKESFIFTEANKEDIDYIVKNRILDYIFPFHMLLPINEKILKNVNINYVSNFTYYKMKRYQLLNLLNTDFNKYLSNKEKKEIKALEQQYFCINSFFLSLGVGLVLSGLFFSFRRKFLQIYLGSNFIFCSKNYSLFLFKNDISQYYNIVEKQYKEKLIEDNETFLINSTDVLDTTLIEDWKCYLYWRNLY